MTEITVRRLSSNSIRFNTHGVEPRYRVDAWREKVGHLLHPLIFEPIGDPSAFEADFVGVKAISSGAAIGVHGPSRTVVDRGHTACCDPNRLQVFLHRGQPGVHTSRGRTRTLPPNTVLFERSDEPRTYLRPSSVRMVIVDLDVSRLSLGQRELRRLAFTGYTLPAALTGMLWTAPDVVTDPMVSDLAAVDSYLTGVVDFLARTVAGRDPDHEGTTVVRRRHALDFMRAHYADSSLSAERVARGLGISRRRLYQLFPDIPPMECLQDVRLSRARQLLEDPGISDSTVEEIATRCGFSSARTFRRAFVRAYSVTPHAYREEHRRSAGSS